MKKDLLNSKSINQPYNYTKLWNQISTKHLHESFEVLIQLRGKTTNIVNNCPQILVPGTVVLMRPGDWHTIDTFPGEPHLHRDIYIRPEKMCKICDFLSPTLFSELTTAEKPVYFNIDANKMQALEDKLFLFNDKDFHSFDYESFHTCIVFEILSDYTKYRIAQKNAYPDWLQNFLTFLNDPDHMSMRIGEFEKIVGYSRNHLSREFRKYTGQTLESYITEIRINYSLSLLACPDFTIVYISNELGYDSQNSFTNNFLKQFGVTPATWRKNHLLEQSQQ